MTDGRARHARLKDLFLAAEELAGDAREQFLRASDADASLLAEVREMLRAASSAGELVDSAGEQVARAAAARLPERIGPYRIVALLGEGGMGLVYEAEQQSPHRRIALKVLHLGAPEHLERIEQEAEALGRLQHEGIAHVYEAGRVEGPTGAQAYLAMELVRGVPLDRFASEQRLSVASRVELVARIADAVHSAHRQGVVHRDLKPDNVLVDDAGHAKVLDFGIAQLRQAGGSPPPDPSAPARRQPVVGTVAYMSPEQAAGAPGVDTSSDVWSLGVLLFELLAGRRPHDLEGLPTTDSLERVQRTPPLRLRSVRPELPADLESAVAKALAHDPASRYASAAAMAADLRGWLAGRPVAAHPAKRLYVLRKFARRNRTLVAGAGATLLALVLGVVFSVAFAWQAGEQRDRSRELSYRMAVRSALQETERGQHAAAAAILAEAPAELRGFEWHHARARLEPWWREYELPAPQVGSLCYLPDGGRVVTATANGSVALVDLASGQVTEPFRCEGKVQDLAVHGGDTVTKLAAAAGDGRVFEWDVRAPGEPRLLEGAGKGPFLLGYAADGRLFGVSRERLVAWEGGRREVAPFEGPRPFTSFGVTRDGAFAVAARVDQVLCWDTATGRVTSATEPKIAHRLVVAPGGREVVLTTEFQNLRVRSLPPLQRIDRDQGHVRATFGLAQSPDGALLASTSPDGTLTTYDATTRGVLGLATRGTRLASVAFRGDGQELVTADHGAARLCTWRVPLSPVLILPQLGGNVDRLLWSPDGELIVASTESGWLHVFDAATGERLVRTRMKPYAIGDDGMLLLVLRDGKVQVWDLAEGRLTEPAAKGIDSFEQAHGFHPVSPYGLSHPDPVHDLYAISRHTWVSRLRPEAASHLDPAHDLYAIARHTSVQIGPDSGDGAKNRLRLDVAGEITAVRFDRRGQRLAAGTRAGGMQIFACGTWQSRLVIPPHVATWIMSLDFAPDGVRLAVACHDNTVRIYDSTGGQLLVELRGHQSHVAAVQWSPDGARLASGSGDATVRIWDTVPLHERRAMAERAPVVPARAQRRTSLLAWRD